jgi:hypothetical protein
MKKIYPLLSAAILLAGTVNAKTYTLGSGKWNDANTWNGEYAGNTIKADDVVIVSGQVTVTNPIIIEGTLKVEKGASFVGMKDLLIAKSGTFINNGNTVLKRIINEGTIKNNLMMEAMLDIENKGLIDNNNNVVAGNNLHHYAGTAKGNGGAYFINNTINTSSSAKFGGDVKVFYGNAIENSNASVMPAMKLNAAIHQGSVILSVSNPAKADVSLFSIEKSTDGKNFTLVEMINKVNPESETAMNYTDHKVNSNITYYRVTAIGSNGEEIVLPVATVKVPFENMFSMAR